MNEFIRVKGAREHNLKNIDVNIPRNKFTVITGLSGSGKSTLAFDTIYAEGQRRYVESLSAYARQFLGIMQKPDVDSIDGLSPAISIEQKSTSKNPRSTIGTVTEIYDYLRLLYARIGVMHCPKCKSSIKPQSAENITQLLMTESGKKIIIAAPIIRGQKGLHAEVIRELFQKGFAKVRVDEELFDQESIDKINMIRYGKHWIEAVIDTVTISDDERQRISESVEQALEIGKGTLMIIHLDKMDKKESNTADIQKKKELERGLNETIYSTFGACPKHPEVTFEKLEPRSFSFNSPFGACTTCHGIGEIMEISPDLVIPDKTKSIMDGAIALYGKMELTWRGQQLQVVAKKYGFDLFTPVEKYSKKQLEILFYGSTEPLHGNWHSGQSMNMNNGWEGIIPQTMRLYKQTESDYRKEEIEKYMVSHACSACKGKRLKDEILAVTINDKSIIDTTDMSIDEATNFFGMLSQKLNSQEQYIAKQVLKEINARLSFLKNVGLGYLSLSRSARTLSGGEAQRIRLATQIGANLMGVLYVLDEPSIGLHQRDNAKLINTLHQLRDLGNTLIVVEHDEDTIRAADNIIDIGPGSGIHGGHIVASGTPTELMNNKKSITGAYLAGKNQIIVPKKRRKATDNIVIEGASANNLKKITVKLPTHIFCAITGVSGSGKSTLMNQTIMPALLKHFGQVSTTQQIGAHTKITIPKDANGVVIIDQDPIGRTPRSNPATYTKIFDEVRSLFASLKDSKERGYKEGRFSFNVKGGRCEKCTGDGVIKIEMNFLPDVYVQCADCKGKRYNKETLSILYKGKSIADVLDMSVEEALSFFENHTSINRKLQTLMDVGLGYIKIGQASTTLSGGESQRIKITRELSKQKYGHTIYLLDEPTTGLHFEDVRKLIEVLNRLVEKGSTVYVIEHNLDVIKCADYIIDMGPEGGNAGGQVIAAGTPEEVIKIKNSYTGQYLKKMLP